MCRLLAEVIREPREGLQDPTLFQLNHVRVQEPSSGETPLTKDGSRLFPKAVCVDHTAQVTLRMREKVALGLSEMDKEEFVREARCGGINFPLLCSVRVLVSRKCF